MHQLKISALVAAALLLLPAGAGADDRSLREAGRSHDAEFARLGKAARAAYRAWEESGLRPRRARRIIRILRRTRREIDAVEAALAAEQPSSENGATYKRLLTKDWGSSTAAWPSRSEVCGPRPRAGRSSRAGASPAPPGCTGWRVATSARPWRPSSRC
jgi:hypothetical protein